MTNTLVEPVLNLVVIRSADIDCAVLFYEKLGLTFTRHKHDNGPYHYSSEIGFLIFEIYPIGKDLLKSTGLRLGFKVSSIDKIINEMKQLEIRVVSYPQITIWGRQAVHMDFDGHYVELTE